MELVNMGPPPTVISTTAVEPRFKVAKNEDVVVRPIANFHPSLWGDYFIKNPSLRSTHPESVEWMKQRVQELIKDVKILLREARGSMREEEMQLIDALQRLGVAYHFEKEISEALSFINSTTTSHHSCSDLHLVALRFRLLRQHLYDAPSDVFNRFKDDEGNFKKELRNDLKGLLSLYEAAYLGMPEEHVLDDAIEFTRNNLQSLPKNIEPRLAKQVAHVLETPFRRRMSRLEARLYIPIYEEDIEAKNDAVLELAKLDFHLLQLLHREEVNKISIWWYDLGLTRELKFMRDRIVESYFWMLGVYFEPQYSKGRMMLVKVITMLAMMDDIYDSYGTLHELQLFTLAIQRWELKDDDDQLDENLQLGFMAIYNTLKELEGELVQDGKLYRINYVKREFGKAALVWLEEAKWREEGYVPSSLAEHLNLSRRTSGYHVLACASLLGIGEEVTEEILEWVTSFPQICEDITTISRLMDDAADSEREDVATTISCCMREYGVSWEEAKLRILGMVENAWKDMNRECLHLNNIVPSYVLAVFVNLARMMEAIYRISDGFSEPISLKKPISLLLVEPIKF